MIEVIGDSDSNIKVEMMYSQHNFDDAPCKLMVKNQMGVKKGKSISPFEDAKAYKAGAK